MLGYGLNKPRSELGKWMDTRGMKQDWLVKASGLSKKTVSQLCNEEDYMPNGRTMQKIIKALQMIDPSIRAGQFWDL